MPDSFDHGYALLIGVGRSSYAKWSLPVTVLDAQALRTILADPALCGYPDDADHIRLLHDEAATRTAILDGLTWLKDRTSADPDATAIVFYSVTAGSTNPPSATTWCRTTLSHSIWPAPLCRLPTLPPPCTPCPPAACW